MRENLGVGTILKYFFILWMGIFALLTVVSCIMHKDAIANAVANNLWALFNGLMPIVLIIGAIIYLIRLAFK